MHEQVFSYQLTKGHHYALHVYYYGYVVDPVTGSHDCAYYDLSMSITHEAELSLST